MSVQTHATIALFEPPHPDEQPPATIDLRLPAGRAATAAYPTGRPGLAACRLPGGRWALARDPRGDILATFPDRAALDQAARCLGDLADWAGSRKLRQADEVTVRFIVRDCGGTESIRESEMSMTRPPIAAADIWLPVMEAAEHRCQCTGSCGKRHLTKERQSGRCEEIHGDRASRRLIAAPAEVTSVYPPPGEPLLAWCRPCYDGTRRIANRAAKQSPPQDEGLFGTDSFLTVSTPGDAA